MLAVRDIELAHVTDEKRTIGRVGDVKGPERLVVAAQGWLAIHRFKRRAARPALAGQHDVVQWIQREQPAGRLRRHGCALSERAEVREANCVIRRAHHGQFTERVRVAWWTEFAWLNALHQEKTAL